MAARTSETTGSAAATGGSLFARLSIRARLVLLAALLLVALVASNAWLASQLRENARALEAEAELVSTLTTAHAATRAFGDLKYWLTDLALSQLVRAETEAEAARARLETELSALEAHDAAAVAGIRESLEAVVGRAMAAVEAYTDDRRIIGNTLMAESRTHIVDVDDRLGALVAAIEADARARSDAGLAAARDAVRVAIVLVVAASVIGLLLTAAVLRSITVPLGHLVRAVSAINAGRLDVDIPPAGRDEVGRMAYSLALLRDSQQERARLEKERERAQALLRRAQTQLVEAIEASSEGFALYDAEDRLVVCNGRYRDLYADLDIVLEPGLRYRDLIAEIARKGLVPQARGREEAWVEERIGRHRHPGEPYEQQRADGRWLRIGERRTEEGGVVGVFTDITELKRREAELGTARDAAMEASRAKSRFLASMSHELRTPLNAIIGYSEMLLEEAEELGQDDMRPDLEKIRSAGRHLLGLINDVLDLSKIEAGKMELYLETFDVRLMLDEVAAMVLPLMRKNDNAFELRSAEGLGEMRADQTKVRQTLFNLLSNAAKFTRDGSILLEAERQADEAGNGDRLVFRVVDTGIGMTEEQLARLFQAFSQADASTSRSYGGTGLGLAISRHFCEMMGGGIAVRSVHGEGSTFTVTLPATCPEPAAEEGPLATAGAAGTVLVIDDEQAAHDAFAAELGAAGYRVLHALSGREGLRLAKEVRPDVVVLDIIMPELDGWAVLRALKDDPSTREVPVILATILGDREMGFALGAADFVTKPVDREVLVASVARFREAGRSAEVLVVDDDPETRDMFRRTLEREGWTVALACNGREALEALERSPPGLVLLDLMMPEIDGFEVLERMRATEAWREIPVIVVTAKDLDREEREWLGGRAARVLQKGAYDRRQLFGDVRAMIGRRVPGAPIV